MRPTGGLGLCSLLTLFLKIANSSTLDYVDVDILSSLVQNSCVLLDFNNDKHLTSVLTDLVGVFKEHGVPLYAAAAAQFQAPHSTVRLHFNVSHAVQHPTGLYVVHKHLKDRKCLLHVPRSVTALTASGFKGAAHSDALLNFVNHKCHTFIAPDGRLTAAGLKRTQILNNVFRVGRDVRNSVTFEQYSQSIGASECDVNEKENVCMKPDQIMSNIGTTTTLPECTILDRIPTPDEFFEQYLSQSRPFIVRHAAADWPAKFEWTNERLRAEFGDEQVHIKLVPPVGDYEGVEPLSWWLKDGANFQVPDQVREQIAHDDIVMVRPHGAEMSMSEFLDLVEHRTENASQLSAYLEYTSMQGWLNDLKADAPEFPFISEFLRLAYQNVWLSDGNTLGKLHFDEYDNVLSQISGSKELLLFEPWNNSQLYEGHLFEANLRFSNGRFHRDRLMQSTAMTMSPVDVKHWNKQRFPSMSATRPLHCVINPGDILYLPAFWWHQVQSRPDPDQHRNLAVNFWYDPFLHKEFPCADCPFDVNAQYRDLLERFSD